MAAANASARGRRVPILSSPLRELTGFYLAVDCLGPICGGERTFAVAELSTLYEQGSTVADVLRRMQCGGGCGGRVGVAWLVTGPIFSAPVRLRRVALRGAEARDWQLGNQCCRDGDRVARGQAISSPPQENLRRACRTGTAPSVVPLINVAY
jgi:hypothetical protein